MKLAATMLMLGVMWSVTVPDRLLTPDTFSVDAASYRSFGFEVSKFGRVSGRFRTGSESRNGIRVFLVDQDDLENFRSGREFRSYYDSGQVSEARVDVQLRYGRYVLIFDNRASHYSNPTVTSTLKLDED
jgi:hypothetical protein